MLAKVQDGDEISDADVAAIVAEVDLNQDGKLQISEFSDLWARFIQGTPPNRRHGSQSSMVWREASVAAVSQQARARRCSGRQPNAGGGSKSTRSMAPVKESTGTKGVMKAHKTAA